MTDITGDFEESIRAFSKVLAVQGRVLPPTLESVRLGRCMKTPSDGRKSASSAEQRLNRCLEPAAPKALPEAVQAIRDADVVVVGPGSLYAASCLTC